MPNLKTARGRWVAVLVGLLLGLGLYLALGGRFGAPRDDRPRPPDRVELPERPIDVDEVPELQGTSTDEAPPSQAPEVDSRVRVVVHDAQGAIRPDAIAYWSRRAEVRASRASSAAGTADASGTILVDSGERADGDVLVVRAPGWLPAALAVDAVRAARSGPDRTLRVRLDQGLVLTGRVIDCWGKPVAGAFIDGLGRYGMRLRYDSDALPGLKATHDFVTTTARADGSWRLTGLAGFPVDVRARKAGFVSFGPLHTASSGDEPTTLVLYPTVRVALRVLDASTKQPLRVYEPGLTVPKGASVGALEFPEEREGAVGDGFDPASGTTWWTLRITGDGVSSDLDGQVRLHARAPGFVPGTVDVELAELRSRDRSRVHTVELQRAGGVREIATVALRLVCPVAQPRLRYCYVRVRAADPALRDSTNRIRKHGGTPMYVPLEAGAGTFGLPPGQYEIALETSSEWLWWQPPRTWHALDVAPGSSNKITLTAPAGLLRVRVIDRDGDPVPGATLGAGVSQRATLLGSLNLDYALGSESFKRRRELHAMAPGEVSLVLSPGEYFFVGSAPGYQHVVERFELKNGERGTITLTLVKQ